MDYQNLRPEIRMPIIDTMLNLQKRLNEHQSVVVSVSGGSDSNIIVHMIATYFREYLPKCNFVFFDTGIEFRATKEHVNYIQERYQITIDRIKGKPAPWVIKNKGVPILSKRFSQVVEAAQRGAQWGIKECSGLTPYPFTVQQRALAQYLIDNQIPVTDACCKISKKTPLHAYLKTVSADLNITGERQAEGGVRAYHQKACFSPAKNGKIDKYMPLWWWSDEVKQTYKQKEKIKYSDCYEIWGMKRTGCAGCPFNSRVGIDLQAIKKHEPNMYKACMHLFGQSYKLMDDFGVHRIRILPDDKQMTLWED